MDESEFFAEQRTDLPGPLAGIRVVEVATTWAGPLCAGRLGDFGAEVIKVEAPGGEVGRRLPPFLPGHNRPLSFIHTTVNRNKQSLVLDLRLPGGREVLRRLVATCDILVENFRPGTMAGWGLGFAELRAARADLICVSISGFGQFGPDHERVGYDPLAQAAAGFMSLNGDPSGGPVKAATWLADDLAGMHGALAALAALRHRDRCGEGQHIDVALLDAMIGGSNGNLTLGALGVPLPRMGSEFVFCSPANVYRCAGGHVYVGVLLDAQWRRLAPLIGHPELAEHEGYASTPRRLEKKTETDRLLAEWCAQHEAAQVVAACAALEIPAAEVRTYQAAAADPHVRARGMLQDTVQEDGRAAPITGPVAKLSRTPLRVRSGAPALGAHREQILEALGYSEAERRGLAARGAP